MWYVLGILTVILLFLYFEGPNALWGGFTVGVVIGIILSLISVFQGDGFNWSTLGKAIIISVLAGFIFEIIGQFANKLKKKK